MYQKAKAIQYVSKDKCLFTSTIHGNLILITILYKVTWTCFVFSFNIVSTFRLSSQDARQNNSLSNKHTTQ